MSSIGIMVRKSQATMFWCMQGLPKAKREAIYTLYAFCRHIDSIAESKLSQKEKIELLNAWQQELENIYEKKVPASNIGRKIYKNCMRFKIKKEDFAEILISARLDFPNPLQAPSYEIFYKHCYGAYEIPAYITLQIIGCLEENQMRDLAKSWGRAIYITRILKDIKEDAKANHLYLPKELLEQSDIFSTNPITVVTDKNLISVREQMARNASADFDKAFNILQKIDKKLVRPLSFILHIYKRYFDIMQNRGWEIISPKPIIKIKDKLAIAINTLLKK